MTQFSRLLFTSKLKSFKKKRILLSILFGNFMCKDGIERLPVII